MTTAIHHATQGFAQQAGTYARGRPDYPAALDAWLRDTLRLGPDTSVVDLGAGTGKFTPLLTATGPSVIAIEPVAAMRAELCKALPEVAALAGRAEAMPLPDASGDVVVCAQVFHWFASAAALAEIRRVLRPGGRLGLVWNVRDESVDWVAALTRIITPFEGDAPRFYKGDWQRVFPAEGFSPLTLSSLPHTHDGPAQRVIVDRFMSVSFIAALPPARQEEVRAQLQAVIDHTPALAGQAAVSFPYRTQAYCCTRMA
jgi:SAM-dependent methyltransferase